MTTYTGLLGKRTLISYVDPCPGKTGKDLTTTDCGRCGGTGYTCFVWVHNGVCFQCGGNGRQNVTVNTVRKHAREAAYRVDFAAEIAEHVALRNWLNAESAFHADQARIVEERAAEAARIASLVQGFIAEEGTKVTDLAVTIKVAKYISGSWNRSSSMFIIAETTSGQVVKVFGSSESLFGLERGDQATLTGKVKEHAEWNGQEQTVLSHVKAVRIETEEEVA
jgi:hypothetical protein